MWKKGILFIAGLGFIIQGATRAEYPFLPFILIGAVLLILGVVSLFRKPRPKLSGSDKVLDDIKNNRPIKL